MFSKIITKQIPRDHSSNYKTDKNPTNIIYVCLLSFLSLYIYHVHSSFIHLHASPHCIFIYKSSNCFHSSVNCQGSKHFIFRKFNNFLDQPINVDLEYFLNDSIIQDCLYFILCR